MKLRTSLLVSTFLLAATSGTAGVCAADESAVHDAALRFAARRWRCEDGRPTEVQVVETGPGEGFAGVRTACHRELDGAYNYAASVLRVRGQRVDFAVIPGHDARGLFNVDLEAGGGVVELGFGVLYRGLGDAGWHQRFRWDGRGFALQEARSRAGGGVYPDPLGPWPIEGPPSRVCRPVLRSLPGTPARVRVRAIRPGGSSVGRFEIDEAACDPGGEDTLRCGGVEYGAVARGRDWVVLRMDQQGQREVFRMPRGCAL